MRELVLFIETHGHAEVILSKEEDVDARNGCDLRDVLDAGSGFNLQSDDDILVRFADVSEQTCLVRAPLREVDRAGTDSRVAGATDSLAGFVGAVDVGDENAVRPEVERLLDAAAVVITRHADH